MRGRHERPLFRRGVEEAQPRTHRFILLMVDERASFGMFNVNGIDDGIGDEQASLSRGGDPKGHVTWGVAESGEDTQARQDLRFRCDQVELRLDAHKIRSCERHHGFSDRGVDRQFGEAGVRHPVIPLRLEHDVARVGKRRRAVFRKAASNVVPMRVRQHDDVDIAWLESLAAKMR